ncbi:MAG: nucleotidyltransferase family protein [Oscillospiraceae bacterium]|nr:nucleotidyltransferase family protein [Oscillospiraceae bacterium]
MTRAESDFLSILKNVVHPETSFVLNDPEWSEIIAVAEKQNLSSLIFDASQDLPGHEIVEALYFEKAVAQVSIQAQKTADFLNLYKAFLEDGISPIVLKGIICRSLYGERADFRASGDEDILISKEDYAKVTHTLHHCGYHAENKPDSGLKLVQEVTFTNIDSPLTVELHLNPFGSSDHIRIKMNEWFMDVFDSQEIVAIDGVSVRTLEPTDHMLFLIFHAFKHFTGSGFGIRMMLDILLFSEKYDFQIDWQYVYKGLIAVGAVAFYDDIVILGNRYLGFQLQLRIKCAGTSPEELLEDMLHMGTFGNSSKNDSTAGRITSITVAGNSKGHNRIKDMLRLLFPPLQVWMSWKPYLKDKPWMLPIEWGKRLLKYLRKGNLMADLAESRAIAERRLELLKKYGVI